LLSDAAREDQAGTLTRAGAAFAQLPQRLQQVLWYLEVEQRSPAEMAQRLGLTLNGVVALAARAREELGKAYLAEVATAPPPACRPVVQQLPGWIRHASDPPPKRIAQHLSACAACRRLAAELRRLNHDLPSLLAPVAAGAPIAIGSLAGTAGTLAAGMTTGIEVAGAGLSILSWATAVKTAVAAAAVVATTVFSPGASVPAPASDAHDDTTSQPARAERPAEPATTARQKAAHGKETAPPATKVTRDTKAKPVTKAPATPGVAATPQTSRTTETGKPPERPGRPDGAGSRRPEAPPTPVSARRDG
jgi:hypothetical protein